MFTRLSATSGKVLLVVLAVLVELALVARLPLVADPQSGGSPREVVLVARDMAFFLEDSEEANPVVRVRAGEEIRLVLRNEDPGYVHWLDVGRLGFRIGPVKSRQAGVAVLRAPESPGTFEYVCTPHAKMMRGVLEVTVP